MFEDSLVESSGRIRTRSRWYAVGSFAVQALLVAVLVLIPYIYPAALPKQALSTLLAAPPPPPATAPVPHVAVTRASAPVQLAELSAPSTIPRRILEETSAPAVVRGFDTGLPNDSEVRGATSLLARMPPLPPVVARARPQGPVRISAGVAAGRLLEPIRPVYPGIAKSAGVQGTVVVEAIISKDGQVENAHAVSGPALLAQAAVDAVSRARYLPFKLNGEAVDVDTTINIIFSLGD
ncbi:MAG TPA: energy transducer TonB [Silvibacterium sp.]|nr:energy transducer TonB [Silvibacterium sp.]